MFSFLFLIPPSCRLHSLIPLLPNRASLIWRWFSCPLKSHSYLRFSSYGLEPLSYICFKSVVSRDYRIGLDYCKTCYCRHLENRFLLRFHQPFNQHLKSGNILHILQMTTLSSERQRFGPTSHSCEVTDPGFENLSGFICHYLPELFNRLEIPHFLNTVDKQELTTLAGRILPKN